MAWLPSHQDLRDHPKLRKLTVMLDIPKAQAIGHLHCLWWWALSYADDGDLGSYDDVDIALAAEWEGDPQRFVNALHHCGSRDRDGFLDRDGRRLHDWAEYGGKYVEKRRKDLDRKRAGATRSTPVPADNRKDAKEDSGGVPSEFQRSSSGCPPDGARREDRGDREEETENNTVSSDPPAALTLVLHEASPAATDPVRAVFDAWVAATNRTGRTAFSTDRRNLIAKQLKTHPLEDLVDAVRGWQHSSFHRGENDRHQAFNDLELLLRDAKHIEMFRDLERDPPGRPVPKGIQGITAWLARTGS